MSVADLVLDTKPRGPAIGWPLLPFPDANGELAYPPGIADSVRQQLQVILSTRPGEQLMRPGFGAGLTEFLGEPDTITTRRRIYDRVIESIKRWEPRVDVNRVEVNDLPGRPGWLRIEVGYRLRRTGDVLTLGVNLEL
jgi:phage baseplate assembly protein W